MTSLYAGWQSAEACVVPHHLPAAGSESFVDLQQSCARRAKYGHEVAVSDGEADGAVAG
jgi:hypothetical protein